ncbi:MAG: ATP synthase F0 subunit C [Candidatus Omnitrophota bacterium]
MPAHEFIKIVTFIASGICIGLGAVGPAIGIGIIGGKNLEGTSEEPSQQGALLKTMLIAMAIAETTAVYSLVVALLLLFVVEAV